jgi:hypothetical protein
VIGLAAQGNQPHRRGLLDGVPLLLGLGAVAAGTAFGWDARLLEAIATPPAIVRSLLTAIAVVGGIALLVASLRRMGAERHGPQPDLPTMIRGVRLAFLAVAAFAAAAGWVIGHPLPIIIALVIAGIDVIETSFLMLVVSRRRNGRQEG